MVREEKVVLDTSRDVFRSLTGKEWYRTIGFKELAIVQGALGGSYRQTARRLDRFRHQGKVTPLSTTQDFLEAEGQAAERALQQEARRVLQAEGLRDTTLAPRTPRKAASAVCLAPEVVDEAVRKVAPDEATLEVMRANPVRYEDPSVAVQVSIDEVVAKKQREHRRKAGSTDSDDDAEDEGDTDETPDPESLKRVHTTVAHVQMPQGTRIYASGDLMSTCLLVLACLTANRHLRSTWNFHVDGLTSLQDTLLRVFAWVGTVQLILDWFHLVKKCRERLSSAMNDRHERNAMVKLLVRRLWFGDVDGAIALVRAIDRRFIKDSRAQERLIGYFERNRPYIPCYAVRKELGLRNSSNRGEKANDRMVSSRQKHNGMAWSQSGSSALATLQTLVANDNQAEWFETRSVNFRLAS